MTVRAFRMGGLARGWVSINPEIALRRASPR